MTRPLAIDFFCGAGGMTTGLLAAGFDVIGVDYDPDAVAASRAAGHDVLQADLSQGCPPELGRRPFLVHLSCPCQPFSRAGKILAADDPRNGWPWCLPLLVELRPTWVTFENVEGLTQHKAKAHKAGMQAQACPRCYLDGTILPELRMLYPWVDWRILNCADFGVPQRRKRLIVIAGPEPFDWPEGDYTEEALVHAKWADGSYWVEHGLEPVGEPSRREAQVLKGAPRAGRRWRTVRDVLALDGHLLLDVGGTRGAKGTLRASPDDPGPTVDTSGGIRVIGGGANPRGSGTPHERTYRDITDVAPTVAAEQIGNAGPWLETGHRTTGPDDTRPPHRVSIDLPSPTVRAPEGTGMALVVPAHHTYPRGFGRAASEPGRLDEPSPTVMSTEVKGTRASKSSGGIFHGGPDRASDAAFLATGRRRLTVAECAVLQGFSPDYPFQGTKTAQYRQVGNACPPALGRAIGLAILGART